MDLSKLQEIITQFESSKLHKLTLKTQEFEVSLEKEGIQGSKVYTSKSVEVEPQENKKAKVSEETMGLFISSPIVGTFYAAPAPDKPPFVKIGDKISKGTVIGIVEAMKVMNEVKADASGTIAEILVHSGQSVEFGAKLIRVITT